MPRGYAFGDRANRVLGGHLEQVYVVDLNYVGADPSRGIRGVSNPVIRELIPRPTVLPVEPKVVEQNGSRLRIGDFQFELAGNEISETELKNENIVIRLGSKDYNIVYDIPNMYGGVVAYYTIFIRGIGR